MATQIILDSVLAKNQNFGGTKKSHDFTIRFDPAKELDRNKNYEVAMDELITMSYSWYNVRGKYGNNTLKWKKNTRFFLENNHIQ